MRLTLLDLDGSLPPQLPALRNARPWSEVASIDLRDLGPRLRLWSRDRAMRLARERLRSEDATPAIRLLGSGDFHHLAVLGMEQAREPITVVHLDNHPDWVRLAPRWHCGSWVNRALALAQVDRVITLGPCSDDLVRPGLKGGNIAALASGKLVLFQWRHEPSRLYHPIPDGAGHRYQAGFLIWRNLADADLDEMLASILALIRTEAVWFSIDKDVLPEDEALTNWDQGQMPLAAVLRVIEFIGARKRVVGADICGEFSPAEHSNLFKRWEARMDQPERLGETQRLAQNERVNVALLSAIDEASRAC
jgi:arginase family enzyme